jgi:hypothetical protein
VLLVNELRTLKRRQLKATVDLQRCVRGFATRERVFHTRLAIQVTHLAATIIQKVFRGSRVMHWRDVKMNVIAAFILDRCTLEYEARVQDARCVSRAAACNCVSTGFRAPGAMHLSSLPYTW